MNQTRGLLAEYGIIARPGLKAFCQLVKDIHSHPADHVSPIIKHEISLVADELYSLTDRIDDLTQKLEHLAKHSHSCQILLSIPGIGPINATAIYSAIKQGQQFTNAREFAVWLGLTPKKASSGEKQVTLGIPKRGNSYLRKQLVHGARAVLSRCKNKEDRVSQWANQLIERRGIQKATVAMTARMARLAWTLLNRDEKYIAQLRSKFVQINCYR